MGSSIVKLIRSLFVLGIKGISHRSETVAHTAEIDQNKNKSIESELYSITGKYDLYITSHFTDTRSDVDMDVAKICDLSIELHKFVRANRIKFFTRTLSHLWREITIGGLAKWLHMFNNRERIELAACDASGQLLWRCTINLWSQKDGVWISRVADAPLKKVISTTQVRNLASNQSIIGPVDVVYTWVNSNDPRWRSLYSSYADIKSIDLDRFHQCDELKYSLRSIFTYAPWVNNIYIFSNCAAPPWFVPSARVQWIMHDTVIPGEFLPLFNSHAIECFLHRIPNLSENYIYFNDDFFLTQPVRKSDFFTASGRSISRMEPYGMLPYLQELVDIGAAEEWQSAAVNGAHLIMREFGLFPMNLHRHAPYAFNRTLMQQTIDHYENEYQRTSHSRLRQSSDVSFASFLYHHYAYISGKSVQITEPAYIMRPSNFKKFLKKKLYDQYRFLCINDGGNSSHEKSYLEAKESIMAKLFPFKTKNERKIDEE